MKYILKNPKDLFFKLLNKDHLNPNLRNDLSDKAKLINKMN